MCDKFTMAAFMKLVMARLQYCHVYPINCSYGVMSQKLVSISA